MTAAAVPREVTTALLVTGVVLDDDVAALLLVFASETGGFAAAVGEGIADEFVVGFAMVAAFVNTGAAPAVAFVFVVVFAAMAGETIALEAVAGVATDAAVVKTGAAFTPGTTALFTFGPFTPKPATPVAATGAAVAAAVTPAVVAGAAATTRPPRPSPVTMGVGGELIEEFTVTCGFAINAGGTSCPVGGV